MWRFRRCSISICRASSVHIETPALSTNLPSVPPLQNTHDTSPQSPWSGIQGPTLSLAFMDLLPVFSTVGESALRVTLSVSRDLYDWHSSGRNFLAIISTLSALLSFPYVFLRKWENLDNESFFRLDF